MKELVLDARWLSTGIGTYTLSLIRELHSRSEISLRLVTLPQHAARLKPYCSDLGLVDASMYSIKEQIAVARAARDSGLLHVPHYNAPVMYQGTLLVTIHDLTHILDRAYKKTLKSKLYASLIIHTVARKAKHIFTPSEYSKRTIIERLGLPENKVTVSYCGVASHFYPEDRQKAATVMQRECGVKRPYILFVGNLKPHKNISGLLKAYAKLTRQSSPSCELVIVGEGAKGAPMLKALASQLGIEKRTKFIASVTDDVLRCAYSAAQVTVLPSFEEGFGLPVIESMACGTPVACSNTAALPEVGGSAATYFDPEDPDSIAAAIRSLMESADRWKKQQQLGFENISRFSWSTCAERHLEVYRRYVTAPSSN
jgi:glycosyltransferase involved in cell wall biosynthesis